MVTHVLIACTRNKILGRTLQYYVISVCKIRAKEHSVRLVFLSLALQKLENESQITYQKELVMMTSNLAHQTLINVIVITTFSYQVIKEQLLAGTF